MMSIATILWRGPERTYAEKLASMRLNTHVETYVEKPELDPTVMHQSYKDHPGLGSDSYVKKVASRATVIKNVLSQCSFALSEKPTNYHLVDEWFVVYLVYPGQEKPRARIQQLDRSREHEITFRHVTAFDHLTQPGSSVDKTQKIYDSISTSLVLKLAFTFAVSMVGSLVVGIIAAKLTYLPLALVLNVAQITLLVVSILAMVRLIQLGIYDSKISSISNVGQLAGQIRRWAYKYPVLAQHSLEFQKYLTPAEFEYLQKA